MSDQYKDDPFITNEDTVRLKQNFFAISAIIDEELKGLFQSSYKRDFENILKMYKIYFEGAPVYIDTTDIDWSPTKLQLNLVKVLIDKTARYMFSQPPDIWIQTVDSEHDLDYVSANDRLVKEVLKKNNFNAKLVKAAKDCLIGKRVALVTNYTDQGISVDFIPSLEFAYETDPKNIDILTKFMHIYNVEVNDDRSQSRVYKKLWTLENGRCYVQESVYNGYGTQVEVIMKKTATIFDYIPVGIITNDGLLGDPFGDSDVKMVSDIESQYSKLISGDIDALRQSTNQITYTIDMEPTSTDGLSRAPGAYWDLATSKTAEKSQGKVGSIDNPMTYSEGLTASLTRLRNIIYTSLAVPDTTSSALQGIVTSGKTMQAIYWDLTVRCNEKMLAWIPVIELCVRTIITIARKNAHIKNLYEKGSLVKDFAVAIDNNYSILQDDIEERTTDLLEVQSQVRSKKSYIKKWQGLTDEEVDAELEQIALEAQMFSENSLMADSYGNIEEASNGDIEDVVEPKKEEVELNKNNDIKGVKAGTATANRSPKTGAE